MESTNGDDERAECDFVGLKSVVCIVSVVIDADKDVYTMVVEDCDVFDKHMNCEMKRRGSCSGVEIRRKNVLYL